MPKKGGVLVIAIALILAAVILLAVYSWRLRAPLSERSAAGRFAAGRAWKHLEKIGQQPRPAGSAAHGFAAEYIFFSLQELGLDPRFQEITLAEPGRAMAIKNIVCTLTGTDSQMPVVLMAHYDSAAASPGVSDDGSGVAVLLETARALRPYIPFRNDLILLFTDGEEQGLFGSRAFLQEHSAAAEKGIVLNFEGIGRGPAALIETCSGNSYLIESLQRTKCRTLASSLVTDLFARLPQMTDTSPFKTAGWSALNFSLLGSWTRYHNPLDDLHNVRLPALQTQGDTSLALARYWADSGIPSSPARDLVFFNAFDSLFIRYSQDEAKLFAGVLVLFALALAFAGFLKKEFSPPRLLLGMLVALLGLIAAALAVLLMAAILSFLHGTLLPAGNATGSAPYFLCFSLLGVFMQAFFFERFRVRCGWKNLAAAAAFLWAAGALASALLWPAASYLLLWPAFFCLLALAWSIWQKGEDPISFLWIIFLVLALVPSLLLFAPLMQLLFWNIDFLRLGHTGWILAAVISGTLTAAAMPLLEAMSRLHKRALQLAAGFSLLALLVAGAPTFGGKSGRPIQSNLAYILDADAGRAFWVTSDRQTNAWTRRFMSGAVPGHPLRDSAGSGYLHIHAPALQLPAPALEVLGDVKGSGIRTLTLHVASKRGARELRLYMPGAAILSATVDGRPIPLGASPAKGFSFSFLCPPRSGFELLLNLKGENPVDIELDDLAGGLPAVQEMPLPPRPPNILPAGEGDITMVCKRYRL